MVEKFSECDVHEKPWYLQENKTQYFGSKCTPCKEQYLQYVRTWKV